MRFLTWGVIGAVILGVARGFQNGTLQRFTKNISNKLNLQNAQQMMQPIQQMAQPLQQMSQPLQQMNQTSQQSKQPQQQANQSSQQMNQSLQNTAINSSSGNSSK
ncbi:MULTISPECIES: hypothetical protein [unclassified Lysinibacillus]|uniref:hypothetical protein n=1 Tax=unclassified Lysinibacillus TaxID=2636778 RepID=UPI002010F9FF|nr:MULTISPECIES: hypothetical protein [unclassified Lysinibacillus]MCL1696629.1 hypothetical protein [Lysinibacillus sp. BPa_S21]MCL1698888.1 hypothetical protein [Lysinibacillus sp. Bpr_S20]